MLSNILLCQSPGIDWHRIASVLGETCFVRTASTLSEARSLLHGYATDVVICGESFAGISTECFSSEIRNFGNSKLLIILTEDQSSAYHTYLNGGDDVIFSPFCTAELLTRLEMLTLGIKKNESTVFRTGQLTVDYENCRVYISGHHLHLTMLEYKLLCLLSKNCGSVVSYDRILRELWQTPIGNEILSLRVFVNAIRKKIRQLGDTNDYLQTHMGIGYCMPMIE